MLSIDCMLDHGKQNNFFVSGVLFRYAYVIVAGMS